MGVGHKPVAEGIAEGEGGTRRPVVVVVVAAVVDFDTLEAEASAGVGVVAVVEIVAADTWQEVVVLEVAEVAVAVALEIELAQPGEPLDSSLPLSGGRSGCFAALVIGKEQGRCAAPAVPDHLLEPHKQQYSLAQ
mmetsp:Transcript_2480/g.4444  ORF Transcript_2480/g.4444 Transcript_2480/m.4444 type:complete len:135 (+) Transcript_2480:1453-1857(+)